MHRQSGCGLDALVVHGQPMNDGMPNAIGFGLDCPYQYEAGATSAPVIADGTEVLHLRSRSVRYALSGSMWFRALDHMTSVLAFLHAEAELDGEAWNYQR